MKRLLLAALLPLAAQAATPWFEDVAEQSGLRFWHFNGMSGEFYFAENVGAGVALFDYDNDGDLDVYLVQGAMLGGKPLARALIPPPPGQPLTDRLFRNDLTVGKDGRPRLRFTDVTEQAGIRAPHYGMGVAAGDYDNDGDVDLYVTNFGPNQLWRNDGNGRFTEVTARAGVGDPAWSVSAAWLDYDRDGDLDLFVGDYVAWDAAHNKACYAPTGERDYCSPSFFKPLPNHLYRNDGNGRFTDVSGPSGIGKAPGPTLGVIVADFNGDGWPDVYAANDAKPNQLWINQKNGTFRDEALLAGVAVNMEGVPEASMGVDAGDFDGDGDEDLFMTHLLGETNTLYVNDGKGWFEDRTLATGLAAPSKGYTAFGTAWFDYDNDGWLDLFTANGEVRIVPIQAKAGDKYPLHQPNQLFHNEGKGRFREVTAQAGPVFALSEVSRGTAFGDIDNDGDTDLVVSNNNGWARLLLNRVGNRRHWLGLRLLERHGRDAYGARVALARKGRPVLWRRVRADGSYASANDPRVLLGLGEAPAYQHLTVYWPDGRVERFQGLAADRYHTLREGSGQPVKRK